MKTKRSYDDACAVAHALDLIGERWALLVVRELLLGPKRFTDLRQGLVSISPNVLTQRLAELEAIGVVSKGRLPPPAAAQVYALTAWGEQLGPAIEALARWAARSPLRPAARRVSMDSLILSFRVTFAAERAAGVTARVELHLGAEVFHVNVVAGELEVGRGSTGDADVVFDTDVATLAAVVYGGRTLAAATRAGDLRLRGDRAVAQRWRTLFKIPEPVPVP